jgi:hypothetical protein
MAQDRFSRRFGFARPADVRIRDQAPFELRDAILSIAYQVGFNADQLRVILCQVLHVSPDPANWSPPNVEREVERLLSNAAWYRVYDFVEAVYRYATEVWQQLERLAKAWQREVNDYFLETGVGWQLVDGSLEIRGSEGFEAVTRGAVRVMEESGLSTASSELHEAIQDLSRRPDADLTGAVQHAMAALECVARQVTGDSNATLGEIIKKFPNAIPKPLDSAIDKAWGFASEQGRHIREGRAPERDEAELIVGMAGALCTYLVRKSG